MTFSTEPGQLLLFFTDSVTLQTFHFDREILMLPLSCLVHGWDEERSWLPAISANIATMFHFWRQYTSAL